MKVKMIVAGPIIWGAAIIGSHFQSWYIWILVLLTASLGVFKKLRLYSIILTTALVILALNICGAKELNNQLRETSPGVEQVSFEFRVKEVKEAKNSEWSKENLLLLGQVSSQVKVGQKFYPDYSFFRPVLVIDQNTRGVNKNFEDTQISITGTAKASENGTFYVKVQEVKEQKRLESAYWDITDWIKATQSFIQSKLRAATSILPDDEAALVRGIIMGDTAGLSEARDEAMKVSSLTHLVAVSGANVALVYAFVSTPLLLLGIGRKPRIVLAASAILLYTLIIADEPSLYRAALMALPLLVARFMGIATGALNSLGLTIFICSLLSPAMVSGYGFTLSALATWGILVWSKPIAELIVRLSRGKLSSPLALVIAVPLVAQIACTPVLILLRPQISIWSVLANILAEYLVVPATLLGFAGAIAIFLLPPLSSALLLVSGTFCHAILFIADIAQDLPGAKLNLPAGLAGSLISSSIILIFALLIWSQKYVSIPALKKILILTAGAALVFSLITNSNAKRIFQINSPTDDWEIALCDVGQGDATLYRASGGETILIDTGGDVQLITDCLKNLGIEEIELLVITHPHADHNGALNELSEMIVFNQIWLCPIDDKSENYLANNARPVYKPLAGSQASIGNLEVEVIWPASTEEVHKFGAQESSSEHSVINDCSLSLKIAADDWQAYTLGDLEPFAQEELAKRLIADQDVKADSQVSKVVKVAHHGSRRQSRKLYEFLKAEIALIGVGENSFSHPHDDTLHMLEEVAAARVDILRTDAQGSVLLLKDSSAHNEWKIVKLE